MSVIWLGCSWITGKPDNSLASDGVRYLHPLEAAWPNSIGEGVAPPTRFASRNMGTDSGFAIFPCGSHQPDSKEHTVRTATVDAILFRAAPISTSRRL